MADLTAQSLSEIQEIQTIRDTTLFLTSNLDQNNVWRSRRMPLSMLKAATKVANTASVSDADDYTTSGLWYFGNTTASANTPSTYGWLFVVAQSSYFMQIWVRAGNASNPDMYIRTHISTGWGAWKKVTTDFSLSDLARQNIASSLTVASPLPANVDSVTITGADKSGYVASVTVSVTLAATLSGGSFYTIISGLPTPAHNVFMYPATSAETYGRPLAVRINSSGELAVGRGAAATYQFTITYIATS